MLPCGKSTTQIVPTKFSYKEIPARCGQTSIRGDMVLCDKCARIVENPPAYTLDDAGEADFEPFQADE
jgi:hypothetical protein